MDDWGLRRLRAPTLAVIGCTLAIVASLVGGMAVAEASAAAVSPAAVAQRALRLAANQRRHLTAAVVSLDGRTRLGRNAGRRVPLGSTTNLLILDEAAHEIARGRLRAGMRIPLAAIDDTFIPGSDSNAHVRALAAERKRGWIHGNALSLRHVLDAMIEFSDNAATDTVMRLIDDRALGRRAARIGQDIPLSPAGLFLSWGAGVPAVAHARRGAAYDATVERLARRLANDGNYRLGVLAGLAAGHFPSVAQQAKLAAALAPRGTAAGYAELMRRVLTGRDAADRLAASVLGWPLRASPTLGPLFGTLAQASGELPGLLTVADGIVPRGQPGYVTVLCFDGVSRATGTALKKADVFDLIPLGVAVSDAFRAQARAALGMRSG